MSTPTPPVTTPTPSIDELEATTPVPEVAPVQAPTLDSVFDALEHAIAARDNAAGVAITASDSVLAAQQRLETAHVAATQADVTTQDAILAKNAAIDAVVAFLNGMRESV